MKRFLPLILPFFLVNCALFKGEPLPAATVFVCPHKYDWTLAQKQQLGVEDEKLASDSMAHRAITEDGAIRAEIASNPSCGDGHARP